MIRRLAKKVLNRLLDGSPRIPSAPSGGRDKPIRGAEWRAQRGASLEPEVELPEVEVQAHTIVEWVDQGLEPLFVDIRERHELYSGYVKAAKLICMNDVPQNLEELPMDRPLIIYCAAGARSYSVAHWLRELGFEQAWSLVGGISSWLDTGAAYEQPERGR